MTEDAKFLIERAQPHPRMREDASMYVRAGLLREMTAALRDQAARIAELEELVSLVANRAVGGGCQFTAEGKHAFLRDISTACKDAGFDVLVDLAGKGEPE